MTALPRFDVAALAAHLVARDTGGAMTLAALERLGLEAVFPYYVQARAILASAPRQPRQ